ncbi:MAG: hypothetical protein KAT05_12030 [Spirochaetes bacterium]|nr:hypothetical protein [Spirochaetota bacterium]MCK5032297.1 hypothetical protein [Calditrichia bacterium]
MEIVENLISWSESYQSGWLKEFNQNNKVDWNLYSYVKNTTVIQSKGINLSQSKFLLISSAGAYLPAKQPPFNAANLLGDYSIRTFPISTEFEEIHYSHDHYDKTAVIQDAQVLLPLRHLQSMVNENIIGEMSTTVISFMGYQPDVNNTINQTIPEIFAIVIAEKVDTVLLVPS